MIGVFEVFKRWYSTKAIGYSRILPSVYDTLSKGVIVREGHKKNWSIIKPGSSLSHIEIGLIMCTIIHQFQ